MMGDRQEPTPRKPGRCEATSEDPHLPQIFWMTYGYRVEHVNLLSRLGD